MTSKANPPSRTSPTSTTASWNPTCYLTSPKPQTAACLTSYAVFIGPQLGRVGLTECEVLYHGRKIHLANFSMSWVARALIPMLGKVPSTALRDGILPILCWRSLGPNLLGIWKVEAASMKRRGIGIGWGGI